MLENEGRSGTNKAGADKGFFGYTVDNKYYVTVMGNIFTVLIKMDSVTSSNVNPCVLNDNEFFQSGTTTKESAIATLMRSLNVRFGNYCVIRVEISRLVSA